MDNDEENLCPFGTPLEPLEEDEIPSKKPIAIEDQIVTDSLGRRRFHGAFTGGFSAGFWNTVGSLEGWKPQSFKSSRSEKAKQLEQKPIDFMDDEDLGEFGIAPQRIQTTEDFTPQDAKDTSTRKRKLQQATGPIPGVPVLQQLLQPAKESVAIRLLKKMGWKVGQGIGARQTRKEKKAASERNVREIYVMKKYGCDLGPLTEQKKSENEDGEDLSDNDDDDDEEITFAPDDFDPYVCTIKDNTFGLGYSGLNRNLLSDKPQKHINLFENAFEIMGKNNKKLSIRGQAFGVGALEEDDEDIYAPDDMTKYDFSLEENKKIKRKKQEKQDDTCIDGFCSSTKESISNKEVFIVTLPPGFKPRNWAVRKSRFEPLSEERMQLLKQKDEYKTKGLGRHDLDPEQRGNILGEPVKDKAQEKVTSKKTYLEKINEKYESEVIKNVETANKEPESDTQNLLDEETRRENEEIQKEAQKITEKVSLKPTIFKPFITDDAKQERYEKFIETNLRDDDEITKFLTSIQPLSMSDWDREMEKKEFLQARNIYKPLQGLMSDRFVSEATILSERADVKATSTTKKKIEIKRTKSMWKPCAQLCKRFNVPEPFGGMLAEEKKEKKPRFSVFDYLESSINRRDNFVTPVIIPKNVEKPLPIISQNNSETKKEISSSTSVSSDSVSNRATSKDFFVKDISTSSQLKSSIETSTLEISNKLKEPGKSINDTKGKLQKPKTELEKKIEESKDKHPSEKKDIFKSIFESSDDEEDEEDNKESKDQENQEMIEELSIKPSTSNPSNTITKDIYATLTKSATEINILRNTSPPRGIFANLFTRKSEKLKTTSSTDQTILKTEKQQTDAEPKTQSNKSDDDKIESTVSDDFLYGPKLPPKIETFKIENDNSNLSSSNSSSELDATDQKLMNLLKKNKSRSNGSGSKTKIIEKWVEKSSIHEDKKKKKKKDKKKKSKKHKKDKKSKK